MHNRKGHKGTSPPTLSAANLPQSSSVLLERPVPKPRHDQVSSSFLSFFFAEIVKYSLNQVNQGDQLEARLHELGVRVGVRVLELYYHRERSNRRDTRLLNVLTFVSQTCWKHLFGHAGELLKGQERENEYMINDKNLVLTKFITVPKDIGHVSCAAYVAGVVEGILCSANFPAEITAHTVDEGLGSTSSTILIRFLPDVITREKRLAGSA